MMVGYTQGTGDTLGTMATRKPRLLITLETDDYERVQLAAASLGVSMSAVVRDYVEWARPIMDRLIETHTIHEAVKAARPLAFGEAVRLAVDDMDRMTAPMPMLPYFGEGGSDHGEDGSSDGAPDPSLLVKEAHDGGSLPVPAADVQPPIDNMGVKLGNQVQRGGSGGAADEGADAGSAGAGKGRKDRRRGAR